MGSHVDATGWRVRHGGRAVGGLLAVDAPEEGGGSTGLEGDQDTQSSLGSGAVYVRRVAP